MVAIPGETIHFFASAQPGVLTTDPNVLLARLRERQLNTLYVSRWFIPYRMPAERMVQVESQLRPLPTTPVNRDLRRSRTTTTWFCGARSSAVRIPVGFRG